MTIVESISHLCEQRGTSLYQVERATGLRNVYRWDTVSPSFDKVVRLADYFGVSVDSLLGRKVGTESQKSGQKVGTELAEVTEAYEAADEMTKEMVRRILGIKKEARIGSVG